MGRSSKIGKLRKLMQTPSVFERSAMQESMKDWKPAGVNFSEGPQMTATEVLERMNTVGVKLDAGKPPLTMGVFNYFPNALLAVAEVSAFGAKKYKLSLADKNWQRVPDGVARYSDAAGRHLTKEAVDPIDEESGLFHDQMLAWNALARLELRILQNQEKRAIIGLDEEE